MIDTEVAAAASPPVEGHRPRSPDRWFGLGLVVLAVVALLARLIPLLRGGGLYALGNYDDGVHFAAAMGLLHGVLPYRDYLLLHPPGVALALTPFVALAGLIGEPTAMAVARLAWMLLGSLNTVLCALVLRPVSRPAALVAGLAYALSAAAIYGEHTALLEAPGTTLLLLALVCVRATVEQPRLGQAQYLVAGALLGLTPTLKIWGTALVLVVVVALALSRGRRSGLLVLGAAVASCTVVCLPFYLAAPATMWRMVVIDQVGRRRPAYELVPRIDDILGLTWWTGQPRIHLGTVVAGLLALAALIVCLWQPRLRMLAALFVVSVGLLLSAPFWFLHYGTLAAAPLALVFGGGLAVALDRLRSVSSRAAPGAVGLAVVTLLVGAAPLHDQTIGRPFPHVAAQAAAADLPGCILTDFPMALIHMNVTARNLDRGCPYEVDLGGASYDLPSPDREKARARNRDWQEYALTHFRSGDAVIAVRFSAGVGFSRETARIIDSWPEIARFDSYVIRRPQP